MLSTLILLRLKGISQRKALEAIRLYGSAEAALRLCDERTPQLLELLPPDPETIQWAENEIAYCDERQISIVPYDSPSYPPLLRQCPDAPPLLFYKGSTPLHPPHSLSIVGTRHITEYGKDLCRHLITDLARLLPDTLIVSGLAYGVDIHAHQAALDCGLPTIGVLAHGLDRIYPSLHKDTAQQMLQHGGLLTEYPIRTRPAKGHFVQRNRIVAAMTHATIVIESAAKGGALITGKLAVDHHRELFACPGRIGDIYSEGCNHLIQSHGARLFSSAEQLIEVLRWQESASAPAKAPAIERELFPLLTPEEEKVLALFKQQDAISIEVLALESGLPFTQINMMVQALELRNILKVLPGGRVRRL